MNCVRILCLTILWLAIWPIQSNAELHYEENLNQAHLYLESAHRAWDQRVTPPNHAIAIQQLWKVVEFLNPARIQRAEFEIALLEDIAGENFPAEVIAYLNNLFARHNAVIARFNRLVSDVNLEPIPGHLGPEDLPPIFIGGGESIHREVEQRLYHEWLLHSVEEHGENGTRKTTFRGVNIGHSTSSHLTSMRFDRTDFSEAYQIGSVGTTDGGSRSYFLIPK
ncbi:MAG: hypothetical protein AAF585_09620, partial [Verrucomicrobiota bacterium]